MQKFTSLKFLETAILTDTRFHHEIKGKRMRKQIKNLYEVESQSKDIKFSEYILTVSGIIFKIQVYWKHTICIFQLRIDYQYPFNRPQIWYHDDKFGQCRDLLDNLLDSQRIWGPSIMLSTIIEKMPKLARLLKQSPDQVLWSYHKNQQIQKSDLMDNQVSLFTVQQYTWKYLIKQTKKRILGFTNDAILILNSKDVDKLLIEDWVNISQVKQANSIIPEKSFELHLIDQTKLYFGNCQQIEKILQFIDPMQMIERRVLQVQKNNFKEIDRQKLMKDYTQLIQFYSLKDKEKMKKYINILHKIIQMQYPKNNQMIKIEQ